MLPEEELDAHNINLPAPPEAAGIYEPVVRTGNLLFVAGHIAPVDDPRFAGRVGADVSPEDAKAGAEYVARQMLSSVKMHLGSLNDVARVVKVNGYVRCTPEFNAVSGVIDGFSHVLTAVFGSHGRAARAAIGVASLPGGTCVEVEAVFEVKE